MGVGDYVHSKEPGQPRGLADLGPSQRQLPTTRSKVDAPVVNLDRFKTPPVNIPLGFNKPRAIPDQQVRGAPENGLHRDAFDTDVEAIDDSTIAGTSVYGFEENQPTVPANSNPPYGETSPRPSYLPRPSRHSRASWLEGMGDKAMKKAGFDSDDADDTSSQATSSAQADDERTVQLQPQPQPQQEPPQQQPSSWYHSHKYRSGEEPLSKRLENFWSASKKAAKSVDQPQTTLPPQPPADPVPEPGPPPRKLGHMLPPTAARKIVLPHSMSATPRTRFSPPKPSLLDQLDISPTRMGSEPPPQTGRTLSITAFAETDHSDDGHLDTGIDETIRLSRRDSAHSSNILGITGMSGMSDLGRDESVLEVGQDPFLSTTSSTRGRRNTVIHDKKRHLEPDYPPHQLYQKSFADLQAEPFERAPTPTPPPVKSPSLPPPPRVVPNPDSPHEMGSHLLNLAGEDRETYLSRMSMTEWEDCGDQLIEQFSNMVLEMRKLRRARRRTAQIFEDEIKRRHENVETMDRDLSVKLNEMRTGGAEVLRGRNS